MLSKLLIMTDASAASDHMLECVKRLRSIGSCEALLVHAMNIEDVGGLYATLRRELSPKLEAQKRSLEEAGFEVSVEIPLGIPFREVDRLAEERGCSAIVVGSRGHSLMKEILLGSTACSVLQNSHFPVLLARIEVIEDEDGVRCGTVCENLFQHILFTTDFSDTAERAFHFLEHIVGEAKSEVTLLHVQDKAYIHGDEKRRLDTFNRIDSERLKRLKQQLVQCGAAKVNSEIIYGAPTGVILEQARQQAFSLILMGAQGRGFIAEIFQGSVAHNIARLAPLPVLFIPALR